MSGRRAASAAIVAMALIAIGATGCGRDDFKNDPSPPVPAEISVKIATDGVGISPKTFGAGVANFTVANLTNQTGSLAIHGPVTAETSAIPPTGTGTIKVELKSGKYEARAALRAEPAAPALVGRALPGLDQPIEDRVDHQLEPREAARIDLVRERLADAFEIGSL